MQTFLSFYILSLIDRIPSPYYDNYLKAKIWILPLEDQHIIHTQGTIDCWKESFHLGYYKCMKYEIAHMVREYVMLTMFINDSFRDLPQK